MPSPSLLKSLLLPLLALIVSVAAADEAQQNLPQTLAPPFSSQRCHDETLAVRFSAVAIQHASLSKNLTIYATGNTTVPLKGYSGSVKLSLVGFQIKSIDIINDCTFIGGATAPACLATNGTTEFRMQQDVELPADFPGLEYGISVTIFDNSTSLTTAGCFDTYLEVSHPLYEQLLPLLPALLLLGATLATISRYLRNPPAPRTDTSQQEKGIYPEKSTNGKKRHGPFSHFSLFRLHSGWSPELGATDTVATRRAPGVVEVLLFFQFVAATGGLVVREPSFYRRFTAGFGWSTFAGSRVASWVVGALPNRGKGDFKALGNLCSAAFNGKNGSCHIAGTCCSSTGLCSMEACGGALSSSPFAGPSTSLPLDQIAASSTGPTQWSAMAGVYPEDLFLTTLMVAIMLLCLVSIWSLVVAAWAWPRSDYGSRKAITKKKKGILYFFIGNIIRVLRIAMYGITFSALFQMGLPGTMPWEIALAAAAILFFIIVPFPIINYKLILDTHDAQAFESKSIMLWAGPLYNDLTSSTYMFVLLALALQFSTAASVGIPAAITASFANSQVEKIWGYVQAAALLGIEFLNAAALLRFRPYAKSNDLRCTIGVLRLIAVFLICLSVFAVDAVRMPAAYLSVATHCLILGLMGIGVARNFIMAALPFLVERKRRRRENDVAVSRARMAWRHKKRYRRRSSSSSDSDSAGSSSQAAAAAAPSASSNISRMSILSDQDPKKPESSYRNDEKRSPRTFEGRASSHSIPKPSATKSSRNSRNSSPRSTSRRPPISETSTLNDSPHDRSHNQFANHHRQPSHLQHQHQNHHQQYQHQHQHQQHHHHHHHHRQPSPPRRPPSSVANDSIDPYDSISVRGSSDMEILDYYGRRDSLSETGQYYHRDHHPHHHHQQQQQQQQQQRHYGRDTRNNDNFSRYESSLPPSPRRALNYDTLPRSSARRPPPPSPSSHHHS